MITAKNKDIKWFNSLVTGENGESRYLFAGVGPAGEFWVNPQDVNFLNEEIWDRGEDFPRPLALILRGVLYVDALVVAELTPDGELRAEIEEFVAMMRGVLKPETVQKDEQGQWTRKVA
jgi:hypothetical protein